MSKLRKFIRSLEEEDGGQQDRILEGLESEKVLKPSTMKTLDEVINDGANKKYKEIDEGPFANRIPTGLKKLDGRVGGGVKKGELTILGARTSVGKSTFMKNFFLNASILGYAALYVALEESENDVYEAIMWNYNQKQLKGIDTFYYDQAEFDEYEKENQKRLIENCSGRLREAMQGVIGQSLIYQPRGITTNQLIVDIKHAVETKSIDVVCVDHLQHVAGNSGKGKREQIDKAVKHLKAMAEEKHIAVLVTSQLARPSTKTHPPPRATIHDFKESGEIEGYADKAFLLHPVYDDEEKKVQDRRTLEVVKSRRMEVFEVELTFNPRHKKLECLEDNYTQEELEYLKKE